MISLIRRIFGKEIHVTQAHIDAGEMDSSTNSPVALAIQEQLDKKYGTVCHHEGKSFMYTIMSKKTVYVRRQITTYTNYPYKKAVAGISTDAPKSVFEFMLRYDLDGTGKPFSFYYCI